MNVTVRDMLAEISSKLLANDYIYKQTYNALLDENRLKTYQYPLTGDKSGPFITIRPLQPQQDAYHASDKEMAINFLYQIDVEAEDRLIAKQLQKEIRDVLKTLRFYQLSGGLDEYFEETDRFVDARRYTGNSNMYETAF